MVKWMGRGRALKGSAIAVIGASRRATLSLVLVGLISTMTAIAGQDLPTSRPSQEAVVFERHLPDGRALRVTRRPVDAALLPEIMAAERLRPAPPYDGLVGNPSGVDSIEVSILGQDRSEAVRIYAKLIQLYPRHDRFEVMDVQLQWPYLVLLSQEPPAVMNLSIVSLVSEKSALGRTILFGESDWNDQVALAAPVNWIDSTRVAMRISGSVGRDLVIHVDDNRSQAGTVARYELYLPTDGGRIIVKKP